RLASLVAILRLMLLDFAMMGVLLGTAAAVMATGVSLPQTALAGMEIGAEIVFAVVVIAPLGEEIAFRSWLSGRPGHLLGLLAAIPAALLAAAAMTLLVEGSLAQIWSTALVAIGTAAVATCAVVVWLRRHDAMGWFARLFPALFWLSTLAFSLVHLFNFPADQLAMALPLVLPQFVIGAILGYTRVTYGL
ncbi:MAG: CPBP family glutamic-type intramembrane protease, partial [Pseudomonadota bacterium]|nr:CPBP family glutamic-type intramembrane protease [Pseudomonadota bacterium]